MSTSISKHWYSLKPFGTSNMIPTPALYSPSLCWLISLLHLLLNLPLSHTWLCVNKLKGYLLSSIKYYNDEKVFFLSLLVVYFMCWIDFDIYSILAHLNILPVYYQWFHGDFTVLFHFYMSWCILVKKLKILPLVVFYPIIVEMGCRLQSKAANASRNWMMRIRSCATAQALFSVTMIFVIFTNTPGKKIVLIFVWK